MKQNKRKLPKTWQTCPNCYQLVFAEAYTTGNHTCPPPLLAKAEAELDMVIYDVMETWDQDIDIFWNSKDVKFWDYLLKTKKEI